MNELSNRDAKPAPKDDAARDEAADAPPQLSAPRAEANLEEFAHRDAQRRGLNVRIRNQLDADGRIDREIRVMGQAEELAQVNTFARNLKESESLRGFAWKFPPPVEEPKTGRWHFHYDARFERGGKGTPGRAEPRTGRG